MTVGGTLGLWWPWVKVAVFLFAALWLWGAGRALDDALTLSSETGRREPDPDGSRRSRSPRKPQQREPAFSARLFLRCHLPVLVLLVLVSAIAWALFSGPSGLGPLSLAPTNAPGWLRLAILTMVLIATLSAVFAIHAKHLRIAAFITLLVIAALALFLNARGPVLIAGATFASLLGFASVIGGAIVGYAVYSLLAGALMDAIGAFVAFFSTIIASVSAFAAARGLTLMLEGAGLSNTVRADGSLRGIRAVPLLALGPILLSLAWALLDGRTGWGSQIPQLAPLMFFFVLVPGTIAPFLWLSLGIGRVVAPEVPRRDSWFGALIALLCVNLPLAALLALPAGAALVAAMASFDCLHVLGGGEHVFALQSLLGTLESRPEDPQFWWAYAMVAAPALAVLINVFLRLFERFEQVGRFSLSGAVALPLANLAIVSACVAIAAMVLESARRFSPLPAIAIHTLVRIADVIGALSPESFLASVAAAVLVTGAIAYEAPSRTRTHVS